jgi:hypothetical protein
MARKELPSTKAATTAVRSSMLNLFMTALCLIGQALSTPKIMKKKIDRKRRIVRISGMEETERSPALFEPDFPQKVEEVRKKFGSLAKFFETQQSRPIKADFILTIPRGSSKASRRRSHLATRISTTTKSL